MKLIIGILVLAVGIIIPYFIGKWPPDKNTLPSVLLGERIIFGVVVLISSILCIVIGVSLIKEFF